MGYGSEYDPVEDPEDDGIDIIAFADFMRATKARPRGEITSEVLAGETIFADIGCGTCHVATIVTAPPGTVINGGAFTVPEALGSKAFHPYSDFLVHDIGTGDGIPVQPTEEFAYTAAKIRTAPLWGLRTRNRLMHARLSFTRQEAIQRHQGPGPGGHAPIQRPVSVRAGVVARIPRVAFKPAPGCGRLAEAPPPGAARQGDTARVTSTWNESRCLSPLSTPITRGGLRRRCVSVQSQRRTRRL